MLLPVRARAAWLPKKLTSSWMKRCTREEMALLQSLGTRILELRDAQSRQHLGQHWEENSWVLVASIISTREITSFPGDRFGLQKKQKVLFNKKGRKSNNIAQVFWCLFQPYLRTKPSDKRKFNEGSHIRHFTPLHLEAVLQVRVFCGCQDLKLIQITRLWKK